MNRRDAIQRTLTLMGGLISAPTLAAMLDKPNSAAERAAALKEFTPRIASLLAEIVETIIPTTKTPGAKAAGVHQFIPMMLADCYPDRERKTALAGITEIDLLSQQAYDKSFIEITQAQRNEVFKKFEDAAFANKTKERHPYFILKDLTLLGYFTSEIGATQALEYVAVPGRYEGCVPLKPGQKAWAM